MAGRAIAITGATKGFGKAAALAFARTIEEPVHFVLSARSVQGLHRVRAEIIELRSTLGRRTSCHMHAADIGSLGDLDGLAESLFGKTALEVYDLTPGKRTVPFSSITFINNAGSLGTLGAVGGGMHGAADMRRALDLNVTGSLFLTHEFVKRCTTSNTTSNTSNTTSTHTG
eukprot:CAMPEP_0173233642 /NCGR_PEP_ID=MMETSP1142-20121109/9727_1 /TAXON_ID=483371 /ORGANISM="non described non described, Strain CCMP2298" /LENGTH=171 /DNA_ID=CAMNT_0014163481 /DNA_START=95 /DNA_END=610 /DNA_ORIENTATION=+